MGLLALLGGLALAGGGCATPGGGGGGADDDPWEPMNRGIFAFNEAADKYVVEPVARGWDFVLPSFAQTGVENFFDNLRMPIVLANDLLQAKPKAAGFDFLRFFYNTTFGIAGFVDVATMVEIPDNDEDFGQTLGTWGVPPGPYLVVPVLGPYTLRDGTGAIVDSVAAPQGWFIPIWASVGLRGVELLNLRAIFLEEIEQSRAEAFDYYAFVRNAYLQNRRAKVADRKDEPSVDDEDLYYFDDSDEDFEDFDEAPAPAPDEDLEDGTVDGETRGQEPAPQDGPDDIEEDDDAGTEEDEPEAEGGEPDGAARAPGSSVVAGGALARDRAPSVHPRP